MASESNHLFRECLYGSVIIITGSLPQDLKAACLAMTHFHSCGFEIKSSNLVDTTFLYTLTLDKHGHRKCPILVIIKIIHKD